MKGVDYKKLWEELKADLKFNTEDGNHYISMMHLIRLMEDLEKEGEE